MSTRILLVEDDENIRATLSMFLRHEGYEVADVASGEEGLMSADRRPADLAIVDVMLPGIDGFELTRRLRSTSDLPIVIVTARTDTHDVVAGLESGADDYVTKPVAVKELAARIRALMRRVATSPHETRVIRVRDLEIHPEARTVRRRGEELVLTRTEFRLLCALAERPGWVVGRTHLLERVWDYDFFGDIRLVDVHVRRLRAKIEDDPSDPQLLVTVRGLGYRLQP